ncbi:hypothetical protein [Hymenobacter guriensis]|uniref:GNAT family N-acetyltransferase n=1 Tax=Hymenobacter guriensis TaxID=2793065 RepID=A0ABS0L7Z5_9BACT|nr:hypothetical protein [Hymenobacter guriensis]MBG8555643.1 hypothetical protein [Hymenobacter guriensis]
MLESLSYNGQLPDSFWQIPAAVYATEVVPLREHAEVLAAVVAEEAARHEVLLYTDHETLRLLGIFPQEGTDAFFGLWETLPDAALNQQVFDQLAAEARRRGYRRLVGPLCFSTYHRYRLRLGPVPSWGQFDAEPVNPAYYAALLTDLGFTPTLTFESRLLQPAVVPTVYDNKAALLAQLQQVPFEFVPLTPDVWQEHEAAIFELVQAIYGANPAYRPVSAAQFGLLYNRAYAEKLCPHTSVLLRERSTGKLVAQSFCHPNYAPLHLPATEPATFQQHYPRLQHRTLLAKTVGVHPDYRQQGLMSYLGAYGMVSFREYYDDIIFCLMRTDNFSRHFTDGFPYETAHYALYAREL